MKTRKRLPVLDNRPYQFIIQKVCIHYGVDSDMVIGMYRGPKIVLVRHIIMYLLHRTYCLSARETGELLSGREHSTVLYGVSVIEQLLEESRGFKQQLNDLIKAVKPKNKISYVSTVPVTNLFSSIKRVSLSQLT